MNLNYCYYDFTYNVKKKKKIGNVGHLRATEAGCNQQTEHRTDKIIIYKKQKQKKNCKDI